jgi:2'-hydroxyisoflavone reductase
LADPIAQGRRGAAAGEPSDPIQIIDGRDLAEWMVRLAESQTYGTFNAVGPDYSLSMIAMAPRLPRGHRRQGRLHPGLHGVPRGAEGRGAADLGADQGRLRRLWQREQRARDRKRVSRSASGTTVTELLEWFRSQPADRQATLRAG